jgi:hypothetical protein
MQIALDLITGLPKSQGFNVKCSTFVCACACLRMWPHLFLLCQITSYFSSLALALFWTALAPFVICYLKLFVMNPIFSSVPSYFKYRTFITFAPQSSCQHTEY